MASIDMRLLAESTTAEASGYPDRLDADMRHVLAAYAALGGKAIAASKVAEARAHPTLAAALQRVLRAAAPERDDVEMEERQVPGPAGEIPARLYTPRAPATRPRPVLLYFHGGSFVLGDLVESDATPRALARRTGAIVLACHYRQAPEHRFPAAHQDALAAWQWLLAHAGAFGDHRRIAVGGEGSGGNLAINVALHAKAAGESVPLHLALISPMAGRELDRPSHVENAATQPLNTVILQWAARKLFRRREDAADLRLDLIGRTDLAGLPSTTIILPEFDPLRSEGEALAEALRRQGVTVDETVYHGVTHGFVGLSRIVNKAMFAEGQLARNLVAAFGG